MTNNMPIKPFSFPLPETRFLHTTKYVYKFKIRYGVQFSSEDAESYEYIVKELLDSIRAILANHDNLHPFSTKHFTVFPYKHKWQSASRLRFKHRHKFLLPFPYVFTVYIEPHTMVYESCSEKSSEKTHQHVVEEPMDSANCRNDDNGVSQISEHNSPRSPVGPNAGRSSGLWGFLMSFTPLRFLLGRRHSE